MSGTATTRGIAVEDLYRLRFAHRVALSPDGTRVAFTLMEPDEGTNRNRYSLLVTAAEGGDAVGIVDGQPADPSPDWSPDGTRLAFVARDSGTAQLWVWDASRADARQITSGEHPVSGPCWSPDGTRLAYLSRVPSLPAPWRPVDFDDPSDAPKVITRARYKFDGMGWFDQSRSQVFVVSADGGAPRQLTHGATGVFHPIWTAERGMPLGGPAWSHDGTRLAFVTSTEDDERRDGRCDVWTVQVDSGAMARVTPNDGLYGCPAWSPDDRSLAVVGTQLPKLGGANAVLWTVAATGGALTAIRDGDLCVGAGLMSDTGAPGRAQPEWIESTIYFLAGDRGTAQIWRVAADGGRPEPVTTGRHAIGDWSLDRFGRTVAFCASTPTSPGEVYCQSIGGPASPARPLTALNAGLLAERSVSAPEEVWVTAGDGSGTRVQGWIMRPVGFTPGRRYPLVLELHGGPHAAYGWSWYHEFQCLAAEGYIVAYGNPRGSTGYGEEFATSIYLDWGTKPMVDVMALLDAVVARGDVDEERLYVTGGSYGGYLVNWVVTHTDRFRAATTGRCVSDLQTLALADDNGTIWMAEYFGGMPWEQPEVYRFGSPITHIADCRTPLFIEHQEQDGRCTLDQAEQMYNALRVLGVETEMVLYPKEPHGMSRNGQPRHRVDRLVRTLAWFRRHGGAAGREAGA